MNLKLLKIARFFHLIKKEKYNEKRQIEIVKKSPFFDAKWYLAQNPDVRAKKIGAARHYVRSGWKEGRNPGPDFDTNDYLREYPELLEKNWCPLFHYMLEHKELMPQISYRDIILNFLDKYANKYKGKSADYKLIAKSKYFNKNWYLKTYPDVKKAKIDPIEHYMKYGWKEGRNPGPKFVYNESFNTLLFYLKYGESKLLERIFQTEINSQSEIDKCIRTIKNNRYKKVILFCSHDYSITGAPLAVYNTVCSLKDKNYFLVVIGFKAGELMKRYEEIGVPCFCSQQFNQISNKMRELLSYVDFVFFNTVLSFRVYLNKPQHIPYIWRIAEGYSIEKDYPSCIETLKKANKLYAVSSYVKEILNKYNNNVETLLYGIKDVSEKYLTNNKKTRIGRKVKYCVIGNFCSRKGHDVIFQAYKSLPKHIKKDVEIFFIGKTDHYNYPQDENLHILGVLEGEQKYSVLADSDILLCPSLDDPNPQTVMEGMMMHKPCIVTEKVGQSKYITNKKDGFILKAGEYKELRNLFIYIHNNVFQIDEMKDLSYKLYNKYFRYETYIEKVETIIEENIKDKFTSIRPAFKENNITVIFSSNDKFVNYLGVAIKSLICNTTSNYNYDIIVCHKDISERSKIKLLSAIDNKTNISIRFIDMEQYLQYLPKHLLYVSGYVPPETYNKFFLTQMLSGYKRCIYIDSDIVILDDIAKLHNMNLDNKAIGASLNIANIDAAYRNKIVKNYNLRQYIVDKLKMPDYTKYFQAGVLVIDMEKVENMDLLSLCLEKLNEIKTPIYFDQCVYNSLFYNNVKFFSTAWNHVWYIQDYVSLKRTLHEKVYQDFIEGSQNPKIVHYAGAIKAHHNPSGNLAEYFWKYAEKTTFYHEILFESMKIWQGNVNKNILKGEYPTILIHLHLYYINQLKYFVKKLKTLQNYKYDLYVTINEQIDFYTVSRIFNKYKISANIQKVPNLGYDVYPFIFIINNVDLMKYDYVLKIHTKNKRDKSQNKVYNIDVPRYTWRNKLVNALIKNSKIFDQNLKAFEKNSKLGMIGCKEFIFDIRNNGEIENYKLDTIKEKFNIHKGYHYVAGTMFLCRAHILNKLKSLSLSQKDFSQSKNTKDHKNFAHIMERILGILVEDNDLEIRGTRGKDIK